MQEAQSYFPNQGSNPLPLEWKLGVLNAGLPGKYLQHLFFTRGRKRYCAYSSQMGSNS